ncbi:hypothetical protein OIU85_017948, partial [Salix viminalis]
ENTEGEYAGLEHEVVPGAVESLKVFGQIHFPHRYGNKYVQDCRFIQKENNLWGSSLLLFSRKHLIMDVHIMSGYNLSCVILLRTQSAICENVDIVVIRENTEGEYVGLEHEVVLGAAESLKVSTLKHMQPIQFKAAIV